MQIQPWQIIVASLAGWINRQQQQIIEFQNAQLVEVKKALHGKRIPFTEPPTGQPRRESQEAGKANAQDHHDSRHPRHTIALASRTGCQEVDARAQVSRSTSAR